jgi:cyclic pyranopterin phosphate synthase
VTCLFSQQGHDLKTLIRSGASDAELRERITSIWQKRTDRYSEERLEAMRSGGYQAKAHKKLEMIVLGG